MISPAVSANEGGRIEQLRAALFGDVRFSCLRVAVDLPSDIRFISGDRVLDCDNTACPLWPFMAYNPHKTKRSKRGRVKVRPDNDMSDLGPKQAVPEIGGHSESDV